MSDQYQKLSLVAEIQSGFAYPSYSYADNGIPIVRMSDLKEGYLKFNNTKYVSEIWLKTTSEFKLNESDFLLGMSGSIENHAKVRVENLPALLNQRVARLKVKDSFTSYDYLRFWLSSIFYHRYADIQAEGAAQKNISAKQIESFKVRLPCLKEQQKIATILTSIDTAIEKTEALIEKYQQIKAGLMHDLFTRGVLPSGYLRPPREQAPELYQETAIGWFPKEWAIVCCSDLCTRICVGIVIQPTQYYVDDGIPALRSANVREDGIDYNNFVYISPGANTLLVKSQIKTGDILSVRTGYPGTSSIVPKELNAANCIDILISSPNDKVISEYLCAWINSSFGKEQVLRKQGGMAQQHFNVGEMRELLVALPLIEEQHKIKDRAKSLGNMIHVEKLNLEKLHKQKQGLMQDLLTGKVKVNLPAESTING